MADSPKPTEPPILRKLRLLRNVSLLAFLVLMVAFAWLRSRTPAVALHEQSGNKLIEGLGPVADFAFTDSEGQPFLRRDLDGHVWVVDFIFTRCAGPCPRMTRTMREITEQFGTAEPVRFLSISVDPEYDTPEVLAEYAKFYGPDPERWFFVTGDKAMTYRLAAESFYLPIEDPEDTDQVIHSTRFVVLDHAGEVRNYHDENSNPDGVVAGVVKSVRVLLSELESQADTGSEAP